MSHDVSAAQGLLSLLDRALPMLNEAGVWSSKRRNFGSTSSMLPLPLNGPDSYPAARAWVKSFHPRRHSKFCFAALLSFSSLCFFWFVRLHASAGAIFKDALGSEGPVETGANTTSAEPEAPEPLIAELPPLYEEWYEFERYLPQQDESLPYPEGANAEFFYASNHVWGLGFNNALQEQLLLSHLAYIANRTYVFDVYTWNPAAEEPFSNYYGKLIPSRIPLTAFISGTTVGGSFGKNDGAPRAVSKPYFQKMCPKATPIPSDDVNNDLDPRADVNVMMEAWARRLRETASKCIEVGNSDQIFNYMVFGDGARVMPFFDDFLNSPILRRFAWSSLVNDAVSANLHLFTDAPRPLELTASPIRLLQPDDEPEAAIRIPGLLAIHVRRGDFQEHCKFLARWRANFMGWLQHPMIVDRFNIPPILEGEVKGAEPDPATTNYYLEKCWPTIDQMVSKIDEVRWTPQGYGLKRVYIMTNGPTEWVAELKAEIMKMGGWDSVASSEDLALIPEQKYIAQAVDMAIAMRSQVFIGNGFSSLSANVILLRLSRHLSVLANRLW